MSKWGMFKYECHVSSAVACSENFLGGVRFLTSFESFAIFFKSISLSIRAQIFHKNRPKKTFSGIFWKIFIKEIAFLACFPP